MSVWKRKGGESTFRDAQEKQRRWVRRVFSKRQPVYLSDRVGGAQWRRRRDRQDLTGHFKGFDIQPRCSGMPLRSHKLRHKI